MLLVAYLRAWKVSCQKVLQMENKFPCPPSCTLIDHRNDIRTIKTQVERRAIGKWSHCKVSNILTSFLWSIRVQTMKNFVVVFFYIMLIVLEVHFHWHFSSESRRWEENEYKSLYQFLSTIALDQSAHKKSLICCKKRCRGRVCFGRFSALVGWSTPLIHQLYLTDFKNGDCSKLLRAAFTQNVEVII